MADSILSLIDTSKWRSALFTSYTLSLTYLESHVLPRLRKAGCQSLTVLVDATGYRDSLMERRARAVGRDYYIVPVSVSGGIFHPKLVHLQAQDGDDDLLLVGSGNLTFPGHGGNVEQLEVLRPSVHANAIREAATFFEKLLATERAVVADHRAVNITSRRLSDVANRGRDTEPVRFIDSLTSSGLDQFVSEARTVAARWDELLVLSPYHHPQAEPTHRLIEELDVKELTVGVSTKKESSAFPFHVAERFGLRSLSAQRPVTEKGNQRALHAKWFEVRRRGSNLVLSGSFNATNESFSSTHNVECGVLRHLSEPTSAKWKNAPRPEFRLNEFPLRSGVATACLFANFDTPSRISGTFVSPGDHSGAWDARLEDADDILATDTIDVGEDGSFAWIIRRPVDEVTAQTLQLILVREEREARGWVHVSRVLHMRAHDRALLQSVARIVQGTLEQLDTQAILDYIAKELPALVGTLGSSSTARANADGEPAPLRDGTVSADEFAALRDRWSTPMHYESGSLLDALNGGRRGWDPLRHICAALMATPGAGANAASRRAAETSSWRAFGRADALTVDDDADEVVQNRLEGGLARVRGLFREHLDDAEARLWNARTEEEREAIAVARSRLLLLSSLVEIRFRLLVLGDVGASQEALWQWLRATCDVHLARAKKAHLDIQVCGVAAVSALWLLEEKWLPTELTHSPKHVHRMLDLYFAGDVRTEQVIRDAQAWLQGDAGLVLTQDRTADALTALREVLAEPTERQVIADILREGTAEPWDVAKRVFDREDFKVLEEILRRPSAGGVRYVFVDPGALKGCTHPACYVTLTRKRVGEPVREPIPELKRRLRTLGFAKCPGGNHYLIAQAPI